MYTFKVKNAVEKPLSGPDSYTILMEDAFIRSDGLLPFIFFFFFCGGDDVCLPKTMH